MRRLLFHVLDGFDGQSVTVEPKSGNDTSTSGTDHRVVAKLLSRVNVTNMYLHDWCRQRADAVEQGDTRVSICPCIEDNTVVGEPYFLHLVDQFPLDVALVVFDMVFLIAVSEYLEVALHRRGAVDTRFACPKQIQVRSVDNQYFHCFGNYFVTLQSRVQYCQYSL